MTPARHAKCSALRFLALGTALMACEVLAALLPESWLALWSLLRVGPVIAAIVLYILAVRRSIRGVVPEFVLSQGGFTTGRATHQSSAALINVFLTVYVGGALHSGVTLVVILMSAMAVATIGLGTWLAWHRHPRLELRPEGVVRADGRRRLIPWEALPVGRSLWVEGRHLALSVAEPERMEPPSYDSRFFLGTWDVPEDRLVHAIEWYATHPEDRPAIGDPAELDRLNTRYDTMRSAAPGHPSRS
jgi:hypothetical protein